MFNVFLIRSIIYLIYVVNNILMHNLLIKAIQKEKVKYCLACVDVVYDIDAFNHHAKITRKHFRHTKIDEIKKNTVTDYKNLKTD